MTNSPATSADGADYRNHRCIIQWPLLPRGAFAVPDRIDACNDEVELIFHGSDQ